MSDDTPMELGEGELEIHVTVDVSEMDVGTRRAVEKMARLVEQNFVTFVEKNADYGSSFDSTGRVESNLDGGPFDDPTMASLYHLWLRTQDKQHRLHNLLFSEEDRHIEEETVVDTAMDGANYFLIIAMMLDSRTDDREAVVYDAPSEVHTRYDAMVDKYGGDTEAYTGDD